MNLSSSSTKTCKIFWNLINLWTWEELWKRSSLMEQWCHQSSDPLFISRIEHIFANYARLFLARSTELLDIWLTSYKHNCCLQSFSSFFLGRETICLFPIPIWGTAQVRITLGRCYQWLTDGKTQLSGHMPMLKVLFEGSKNHYLQTYNM